MNHKVHFSRLIQQQFVTRYFVVEKEFPSHITLTLARILLHVIIVGYADNNMQHDIFDCTLRILLWSLNWLWLHRAVASHLCKLRSWVTLLISSLAIFLLLLFELLASRSFSSPFDVQLKRTRLVPTPSSTAQQSMWITFSRQMFFFSFSCFHKKIVNFFSHKS